MITGSLPASLTLVTGLKYARADHRYLLQCLAASVCHVWTRGLRDCLGFPSLDRVADFGSNMLGSVIPAALSALTGLTAFDLSFNGLGGTLPTAVSGITGANFSGNCFPGYPPIKRCDGYYIGAVGATCTATCASAGARCDSNIDTGDSPNLMLSLLGGEGVSCTTPSATQYVVTLLTVKDPCEWRWLLGVLPIARCLALAFMFSVYALIPAERTRPPTSRASTQLPRRAMGGKFQTSSRRAVEGDFVHFSTRRPTFILGCVVVLVLVDVSQEDAAIWWPFLRRFQFECSPPLPLWAETGGRSRSRCVS